MGRSIVSLGSRHGHCAPGLTVAVVTYVKTQPAKGVTRTGRVSGGPTPCAELLVVNVRWGRGVIPAQ